MKKKDIKVGDLVRGRFRPGDMWLGMVIYPPGNGWVCVATVAGEISCKYKNLENYKQKHSFWMLTFHLDVVASGQEG